MTPGCADKFGRGNYECGTTDFIKEVKTHGLKVHAFTFRNEWMKLYWDHGQDPYRYAKYFVSLTFPILFQSIGGVSRAGA